MQPRGFPQLQRTCGPLSQGIKKVPWYLENAVSALSSLRFPWEDELEEGTGLQAQAEAGRLRKGDEYKLVYPPLL